MTSFRIPGGVEITGQGNRRTKRLLSSVVLVSGLCPTAYGAERATDTAFMTVLWQFGEEHLGMVMLVAAGCLLLLALGLILYSRSARRYEKRLLSATEATEAARDQLLAQMKLTETYHRISETDALTGLLNRCAGETRIDWMLRHGHGGMFCLLDVDQFKQVNDTFGHGVGDEVLKSVSRCLTEVFRESDVILRLGGDEFGVFAEGIDTEKKGRDLLCRLYAHLRTEQVPGMEGGLSLTTGAVLSCEGRCNFLSLYEAADLVMYRCKGEEDRFCLECVSQPPA